MRLSVIGLGKLGSPLAAVFASKGHRVIGVDVNAECVRLLTVGKAPVQEPHLQDVIDRAHRRLTATLSCEDAVLGSDLTFVTVPTPSDGTGVFSGESVVAAVEQVGSALRKKTGYHVVGIASTVMPGTTGGAIREALEKSSGRLVGDGVGLCYTPTFVALGSAVHDILAPDFVLLGESDSRAGDVVERLYRDSCDNAPPIRRMGLMNAEIAKLAVNTYVTTKISYANMLAEICEGLPGADVDVVTSAIGLDSRIGPKSLTGATGYGGPCFPRDNRALGALARRTGARADIAEATDRLNRYQVERLAAHVRAQAPPGATIGILGLSYKPDTPVVEASPGVALAMQLKSAGYLVKVFDPMALDAARASLGPTSVAASMDACAREADVLVITTPWPVFRSLDPASLRRAGRRPVVIDCWRLLPRERFEGVADVAHLGSGDDWSTGQRRHGMAS
ncbi:MAG TPA: nucleotide sugar dehydrogenase [Candidatus Methylomirabilis sp.]|nr:nucleotide sugar dehydrogenase [Candidatus Methylomirabilis sp.]